MPLWKVIQLGLKKHCISPSCENTIFGVATFKRNHAIRSSVKIPLCKKHYVELLDFFMAYGGKEL